MAITRPSFMRASFNAVGHRVPGTALQKEISSQVGPGLVSYLWAMSTRETLNGSPQDCESLQPGILVLQADKHALE